jgi:hypothetical protein
LCIGSLLHLVRMSMGSFTARFWDDWGKMVGKIYTVFSSLGVVFLICIFANFICLVCIVYVYLLSSYLYLLYCVYCCSYFICRTPG